MNACGCTDFSGDGNCAGPQGSPPEADGVSAESYNIILLVGGALMEISNVSYAAVSIGENSDAVTEFLEKNYKSDMTLEDGASLAAAAINLKEEKKDGAKHVKMSWIKLDKQIMEKVSDSDIENFVQSAKQKFSK